MAVLGCVLSLCEETRGQFGNNFGKGNPPAAPANRGFFGQRPPAGGAAAAAALLGQAPAEQQKVQRWLVGVEIFAVGGSCRGVHGSLPVPSDWTGQEVKIVDEETTTHVASTRYRQLNGVRQLYFSMPQVPAGETGVLKVTLEIHRKAQPAPKYPDRFIFPEKIPRDIRPFLAASPSIEVRNKEIRQKAEEITAGIEPVWEQVEAIYDWVRDNVKYERASLKGAASALKSGKGGKEDLVCLFIALCRAKKIPARTVWVPDHCYAEFYLMAKNNQGYWLPCQVAGTRDFGAMPDLRPVLQKGENIQVPGKREPQRFVNETLTASGGRPQVKFIRKLLPAE